MTNHTSITTKHFYLFLLLIMLVGAAIRLPGVQWVMNVSPENWSLHPDENIFAIDVMNFGDNAREGYVRGFTSHIFLVNVVAKKLLGHTLSVLDLVRIGRLFSLFYGLMTIGLLAIMVRSMTGSPTGGLLSAAFLSLAPLHVIHSHFGTADSAATFYFYLSAFCGWYYVKHRSEVAFALFVTAIGACLAVKFFLSLLIPLALVLLMDGKKWYRAFLAVIIMAGSFSLFSFFNYSPWDLHEFVRVLKGLYVSDSTSRLGSFVGYSRSWVSSLGLMASLFVVIGIGVALVKHGGDLLERARKNSFHQGILRIMSHPNMVVASLFVTQLWLITGVGPSGIGHPLVRHSLPFIPLLCFAASVGFLALLSQMGRSRVGIMGVIVLVFGYQVYNAVGTEQIFRHDIRNEASQWVEKNVSGEETVTAFMPYSKVGRNVAYNSNPERLGDFIATCDLEYERYFRYEDPNRTPPAHGGKKRAELFRELFAGRLNYKVVQEFHWQQYTLEQDLMEKGILGGLHTFTPRRCVVFKRIRRDPGVSPLEAQRFSTTDSLKNAVEQDAQSWGVYYMCDARSNGISG